MDFSYEMWRNVPGVVAYHWRERNFDPAICGFLSLSHLMAVVGALRSLPRVSSETVLWMFVVGIVSGFGVTVGLHRYWAHRSFETCLPVRVGLMLCAAVSYQGGILNWCRDHRVHHEYSDTDADPHNATRGFFYSHVGWLLTHHNHPANKKATDECDISDLLNDPVVMFQYKLDPVFDLFMSFIMPGLVAKYGWDENLWDAIMVCGFLRFIIVLHGTFLVNSANHAFGDHPYDASSLASENPAVAICTMGEGWHNWHHKYPYDYAASEFGIGRQFNLSKLVIDALAAVGLVWGRKRAMKAWEVGRQRRDRESAAAVTQQERSVSGGSRSKGSTKHAQKLAQLSSAEEKKDD